MRLIDADKLETHEQLELFGNGNYEYVEVVYKDDIDNAPTIEPKRIAKATKVEMRNPKNVVWKCSMCGQYTHQTSWSNPVNYCSSCGCRLEWE